MIQLKQHKKFKNDMSKVTFSDSQFNKYIQFLHLLANEEPLPIESKNHPLKGDWKGFTEFHIGGDLLVIYHYIDDSTLELIRIGTHNQLFKYK